MRRAPLVAATLIVGCAVSVRAQSTRATSPGNVLDVRAIPADSGLVLIRGDRLDAIFPIAPMPPRGCGADSGGAQFHWSVGYAGPRPVDETGFDVTNPKGVAELVRALEQHEKIRSYEVHTEIAVDLPPSATPTTSLLDSLFAQKAVAVWTRTWGSGHPPIVGNPIEPELRAIYFDNGRVHYVIKGAAAVNAFLAFTPDSVRLEWCSSVAKTAGLTTPLVRRD